MYTGKYGAHKTSMCACMPETTHAHSPVLTFTAYCGAVLEPFAADAAELLLEMPRF